MSRYFFLIACFCATLSLISCGSNDIAIGGKNTVVSGKAAIGGAYDLINHEGLPVTHETYLGKPQLIYFGFGYCPDVCPTALQQMGAALDIATKKYAPIKGYYTPLFVTIDPERDTPKKLALYVNANGFPEGLTGLTGTLEQIERIKKAYAVIGQKVDDPTNASGYTYDHSSLIYLMDVQGEFVDIFTHADSPAEIANRLIEFKKNGR